MQAQYVLALLLSKLVGCPGSVYTVLADFIVPKYAFPTGESLISHLTCLFLLLDNCQEKMLYSPLRRKIVLVGMPISLLP